MRHKHWKNSISFFMAMVFVCLLWLPSRACANDVVEIEVEVTYKQTEARKILDMINGLRGTDDAWYWDSDNVEKQYYDVGPIQWDYALEQIAMQRAAEAAYYFSHTRPDGSQCSSVIYNGVHLWGENLGWGYETAEEMFEGWCEWQDDYAGQGHRRQLLARAYVGIAHVVVNGEYIWAAAFSNSSGGTTPEFPAVDGKMKRTLTVDVDYIGEGHRYFSIDTEGIKFEIEVPLSEATSLPNTTFCRCNRFDEIKEYLGEEYENKLILPEDRYSVIWSISDTSIAEIRDGMIYGKTAGETRLSAKMSYMGKDYEASCIIRVTDYDLAKTLVLIEVQIILTETTSDFIVIDSSYPDYEIRPVPDYIYTGEPVTILLHAMGNGEILFEGRDYETEYRNNVGPGTATVIVKGIGKYYGQREYSFQIIKPDPTPIPTPTATPMVTVAPTEAAVTLTPTPTPTDILPTDTPTPTDGPSPTPDDGTETITPEITEEPTPKPSPTEEVLITPIPIMTATPVLSQEIGITPTSESEAIVSPTVAEEQVTPTGFESETDEPANKGISFRWIPAMILIGIIVLIIILSLI